MYNFINNSCLYTKKLMMSLILALILGVNLPTGKVLIKPDFQPTFMIKPDRKLTNRNRLYLPEQLSEPPETFSEDVKGLR